MQVILMAQSMSCRYKDAFSDQSNSVFLPRKSPSPVQFAAGSWQLIIKVSGFRDRKKNRSAFVYEAVNLQGVRVFFGVNSSLADTPLGFFLKAVVEACLTAKHHGFSHVLLLRLCLVYVKYFPKNKYFSEMLFTGKENIFNCLVAFWKNALENIF